MATVTHSGRVHIDAPVPAVFDHVAEPQHFLDALPDSHGAGSALDQVVRTADGRVAKYSWTGTVLGLHPRVWLTREEDVPNERIVDHSSAGPFFTYVVEPDGEGTSLSLTFALSGRVAAMLKARDAITWSGGDADIDLMLGRIKAAVER